MIINPSFEEPDELVAHEGVADGWTSLTVGSREETARFAGDSAVAYRGQETFAHGWSADDPQFVIAAMVTTQADPVLERFETWRPGQTVELLGSLESAVFTTPGGQWSFDAFEDAWETVDAGLGFALEATASLPTEVFDFGWGAAVSSLDGLTQTAVFGLGGQSTNSASGTTRESFGLRARVRVIAEVSDQGFHLPEHAPIPFAAGNAVTFVNEGGVLPTPLSSTETYQVIVLDVSRFRVAAASGGSAIQLTTPGTGQHYAVSDPGRFWIDELL